MTQDEFFRRATIEICGDLQIEFAMRNFIRAVSAEIPIDHMFLQRYEADMGAMRTIATATTNSGEELDILTPMPDEVRDVVRGNFHLFREGLVVITDPGENPVAVEMLKFHGIEGSSILQMSLIAENERLCGIVLTAMGEHRYTEKHIELLRLLRRPFTVALSNTLTHRELLTLRDRLDDDNKFLHGELRRISGDEIIGADFGLSGIMEMVRQVAGTDSPVLVTGETGVGKDLIANAVHLESARNGKPFIAVNCGAIPETLVDSELFGHEKGAFTGALSTKRGRFERADGGTIFLDEIGEMPLSAQIRLLRVLQNKELERVGGSEIIHLDTRVIAASNRNLNQLVNDGKFREDLLFRLNVFPIDVPPLRNRTIDIPSLVQHFINRKAKNLKLSYSPSLAPGAIDKLLNYSWPGNVRELENVIERAMILCRDGVLRFDFGPSSPKASNLQTTVERDPDSWLLEDVEKNHILRALNQTSGKIHGRGGAGELLGINPNTLRHRMRKLEIPFKADR